MRSSLFCAAGLALVVFACATGNDPSGAGDTSGDGTDDSGTGTTVPPDTSNNSNPYSGKDGGSTSTPMDSGTTAQKDSGSTTSQDSGTVTQKDSGTTMTGSGDDCVGTDSTSIPGESYDDECDAYYNNSFGMKNNCTPGGNECTALNGQGGYTFCCYNPSPGDFCKMDYSKPQCVPQ